MNYIGNIYRISPMESREFNGNNFYSRRFAIEQKRFDEYTGEEKKSNFIEFEVKGQQNCANLDDWKEGTKVTVTFFIEGTKYNKKDGSGEAFFNKLIASKIELWTPNGQSNQGQSSSTPATPASPASTAKDIEDLMNDDDDLPL